MNCMCIIHMQRVSALLVCVALHPQMTRRHCSKFSVAPLSIWTSQNSSAVITSVVFDSLHSQARWQLVGQLQFHCLSRLNPFIPCVCAFTYLSSSIIFTADMSSSRRHCRSVEWMQLHMNTSIYRNTWRISGHTRISGTRVRQTQGKWYRYR